jgi:hypothetical protein
LIKGFQVLSIADIIRRERHDPPMTDEERQRAMAFIVEQTAKNSVEIEKLIETHRRAENRLALTEHRLDRDEYRLDRDERLLKLMIRAARRERRLRREQDERFDRRYQRLLESQAHTDNRLDALVDIVRQRNGG